MNRPTVKQQQPSLEPPPIDATFGTRLRYFVALHKRKLILAANAAVLLAAISGYAAWRYVDYRVTLRDLRADAYLALEANDLERAQHLFTRYLASRPNDANALHSLARCQLQRAGRDQSGLLAAVSTLENTLELDPRNYAAKRSLLETYLRLGYREEAEPVAEDLFRRYPRDPMPFSVLVSFGLDRREFDRVITRADAVLSGEIVPEELRDTAMLAKARAYVGQGKTQDAMYWVEQCVKVSAANLQAQELYLSLCERLGRPPEELSRHARRLVEQNPEVSLNHLMLAIACRVASDQASRRGDLEAAEQYALESMQILRGLTRRDLTPVELRMLLDELQRGGAREDALVLLGEQADREDAPWVAREYARRALVMGRAHEASTRLARMIREGDLADTDTELVGLAALAEFMISSSNQDAPNAEQLQYYLDTLRGREYDPIANAWCYYLADQGVPGLSRATPQERVEMMRQALSGGSSNPLFYAAMGHDLLNLGQTAEGQAALLRAAAWAPYWGQPLALLSQSLRQGGQRPEAFRVATQALSREPGRPQVQAEYLRAAVDNLASLTADHRARVTEWADRLSESPPPGSEIDLLACRIALHAAQGDHATATRLINETVESLGRDNPGLVVMLARLSSAHGLDLRDALIERVLQNDANYLPAVVDRAAALLRDQGRRAALDYFQQRRAAATDGESAAWALSWVNLLESANDPRAAEAWRKLAEDFPDSVAVTEAMADNETVWRDAELVARVVDRLTALGLDSTDRAVLADIRHTLLFDTDGEARARATDRLETLVRAHPATASLSTRYLLGDAMGMAGRFGDELSLMASVIQRGELPADYHVRFSRRLRAVGAVDEANRVLASLAQRPGGDRLTAARIAASNLAAAGELDRALSVLHAVHATASQGSVGPVLGQLYLRAGQADQARNVARQMARLDDPQRMLDAATLHAALGDTDAADALARRVMRIADAEAASATEARVTTALADYLFTQGQTDDALEQLVRAAEAGGDRVSPWTQAIVTSLRLGDLDRARAIAQQAAESTGLSEHFGVLEAAAPSIERALGMPDTASLLPLLFSDPHARASLLRVLASLPELSSQDLPAREAALAVIIAAADRHPDLLALQSLAVSSLVLSDHDTEAIARVDRTLTVFGDQAALADVGARLMAEDNHLDDAIRYASVWRSRQGRSDEADLLLIDLLGTHGPAEQAPTRLARYLREVEAGPGVRPDVSAAVGRVMLRTGHREWVESTLWPWAEYNPIGRNIWGQLAKWQPTLEAGDAWLERLVPLMPDDAPTGELINLYSARIALAERFEQRERLQQIHEEIAALPAPHAEDRDLLNLRGTLAISIGRLDEAVAIYRGLHERYPGSIAATNNLAYALQQTPGGAEEAVRLARLVVARNPSNGEARDTLAMALFKAGVPREAEVQARLAAWFSPYNLTVRVNRATVLAEVAGHERARAELDRLYPQLPLMTQRSADSLDRLRQLADAVGSQPPPDLVLSAEDAPAKPPQS